MMAAGLAQAKEENSFDMDEVFEELEAIGVIYDRRDQSRQLEGMDMEQPQKNTEGQSILFLSESTDGCQWERQR